VLVHVVVILIVVVFVIGSAQMVNLSRRETGSKKLIAHDQVHVHAHANDHDNDNDHDDGPG
jgi:hypothetical protein